TTEDGLPHRYVTDLLETRRGVYWVATYGGLCRFNPKASDPARPPSGKTERAGRANGGGRPRDSGARFVGYRLSEDPNAQGIKTLLEDRAGRIWCGTDEGGLYRLEESNGQWIPHRENLALPAASARRLRANALLLDGRGAVWIGADTGLFRYGP